MWTDENRGRYDRSRLRHPSGLADAERALVQPVDPPRGSTPQARRGGNKRTVDVREAVNGLMHVPVTGCRWRAIPKGPAASQHDQPLLLPLAARRHAGPAAPRPLRLLPRARGPRGESNGGRHRQPGRQEHWKRGRWIDPPGFDGARKIKGRKRHVLVDTQGLLMEALVHAAGIQDRDGGVLLMATLFGMYPFLPKLCADAGCQGPEFQQGPARTCRAVNVEIVRRCDTGRFVVLPERWIVERTIAWLNRCRRLGKDWERLNRNALAFLRRASVRPMARRPCNPTA